MQVRVINTSGTLHFCLTDIVLSERLIYAADPAFKAIYFVHMNLSRSYNKDRVIHLRGLLPYFVPYLLGPNHYRLAVRLSHLDYVHRCHCGLFRLSD